MNVQEAARAILKFYGNDASRWCQGARAKTADGVITGSTDPDAVKWCISGACQMVGVHNETFYGLQNRMGRSMPGFNDYPGRTFADVVARLEAIANE